MVQASELRIGNWLTPKDEYYNQFHGPAKVTSIRTGEDDDFRITMDYHYPGKWFEPIPIAPEILEKCGFTNRSSGTDYAFELGNFIVGGEGRKLYPAFWGDIGLEPIGRELLYLHQLQNLYHALTGEELVLNAKAAR